MFCCRNPPYRRVICKDRLGSGLTLRRVPGRLLVMPLMMMMRMLMVVNPMRVVGGGVSWVQVGGALRDVRRAEGLVVVLLPVRVGALLLRSDRVVWNTEE